MEEEKQDWFGTFGGGSVFHNRYYLMKDMTREEARELMFDTFGNRWSHLYSTSDLEKQIQDYNLKPLI